MADYAISPEFLKAYRDWQNQRWATTGIPPRPEDIQALMEANLAQQAANRYRDIQIQQRQQEIDMQKKAQEQAARAATISGAAGLGTTALLTYGVGKQLGWWGATAPTTATPTITGAEIASAAGRFAAPTAEAAGFGLGMATPTAPSLATPSLISETGGYVGAGTQPATATAPGLLGTVGPYAGTVGASMLGYKLGSQIGGGTTQTYTGIGGAAAVGAALGTYVFPGIGTGLGAAIGAITGAIEKATDTIICTELHRQGMITERIRRYGMMFARQVGEEVYQGYLVAATPVVERMRQSRMFTRIVALIAKPVLKEMMHRVNPRNKGSIIGGIILHFGIPYCLGVFDRQAEICKVRGEVA